MENQRRTQAQKELKLLPKLLNPTTSEKERRRLEREAAGVGPRLDVTKEVMRT